MRKTRLGLSALPYSTSNCSLHPPTLKKTLRSYQRFSSHSLSQVVFDEVLRFALRLLLPVSLNLLCVLRLCAS